MAKVIVVGATSGIGRELAAHFSRHGHVVGIVGRREHLLEELRREHPNCRFSRRIDISRTAEAITQFEELVAEMEGADIVVLNAGVGFINPDLHWDQERETIEVNVAGFAALATVAMQHFLAQGRGQLVGISSIAAIRGDGSSPAYNASKAFVSSYLQGLRKKASKAKMPITVTDIQPGFVDTSLARGENMFWVASAPEAARQIYKAILTRRSHAYVTKRWRLVAWLLKSLPDSLYHRI